MGHPMRIELTRVGLLVYFANHYTTWGAPSGGVMVSKLDKQTYTSELESHWAPYFYDLVPYLSKKVNKLPHRGVIIILSCHQHGYPWLSLVTPPYRSSLLAGPQGYTPYPHRAAVCRFAGHTAFARPYEGVHRSTSLMSLSLLLQQCPAFLVRLTLIVFVMGGR